jgi:hypothetical protein
MTAASRPLAEARWESTLRERLAPPQLHHQLAHDPRGPAVKDLRGRLRPLGARCYRLARAV